MRKLIPALTLLTTLVVGGVAVAGPGMHGGGHGMPLMRALQQIDLTEAQQARIDELRERHREDRPEVRHARRATMEQMRDELLSDAPDTAKLRALIEAQHEERKARALAMVDDLAEISRMLTPEQKTELAAQLDEMAERRAERMQEHRGGKRGRGGPGGYGR